MARNTGAQRRSAAVTCTLAVSFIGAASAFLSTAPLAFRGSSISSSAAVQGRLRLGQHAVPAHRFNRGTLNLRAAAEDWARHERVSFDGDSISYTEEVEGAMVGVAQAKIPLSSKQPFYEVTVEDGGTQSWIGVGLAVKEYTLDKQPGWEAASIGYHADDGMYYRSPIPDEMSKSGRPVPMPLNGAPFPCEKGDKMGIGLEFDDRGQDPSGHPRRVYFTKNGQYLGSCLLERQFHEAYYPTVGFNSPGAKVTVNLKASPASAQVMHAAQAFGTNEYAIDKDQGADPDVQDLMGLTPLHMAAGYVRPSTIKLLIENGADPELRTKREERPMDVIRNLRNATKETSMGGLMQDKRYPLMTEIVELLEAVTEDTEEWVVPAPPQLDKEQEAAMKDVMDKAKDMVEEMKKDPEKMKELEKAMELMKDKEFQEKVKQYANDPAGMSKLIEEYKDKV
eukprot:CAMPEP_0181317734 /NCGR_PEP_ID=MMETSP1101-20121128/16628_1 /TAXON_ID=46948 /ORGANISM="Rhodomonas abbreviata, Strain Caron Lab Isolate" /LENGTH=450 /DNA_ID=CAMNT_0023425151 /DNA_START=9 /DNA_END=1361 /DNA_ORIENTATION=-